MPVLADTTTTPTFIVAIGNNGQLTVSQIISGDLSSATLNELFAATRDIAGTLSIVEAMIIRNLT